MRQASANLIGNALFQTKTCETVRAFRRPRQGGDPVSLIRRGKLLDPPPGVALVAIRGNDDIWHRAVAQTPDL